MMRNPAARVSDPNSFSAHSGDQYHVIRKSVVLPDGTIDLVESGKDDIQAMIDAERPSTDMALILSRLNAGDTSVLNRSTPMYGDFTSMPSTYAEALQLVIDGEREFMQLPLDVRNQFDNDFRRWFAQAGSDSWYDRMMPVLKSRGVIKDVIKDVDAGLPAGSDPALADVVDNSSV